MEATRRGFLKGVLGTSLLGLFMGEKLVKDKVEKLLPAPVDETKPHVSDEVKVLGLKSLLDPAVPEPVKPAPHEGDGHFCPFTGDRVTGVACSCLRCAEARSGYWQQVQEQVRKEQIERFGQYPYGVGGAYSATAGFIPQAVTGYSYGTTSYWPQHVTTQTVRIPIRGTYTNTDTGGTYQFTLPSAVDPHVYGALAGGAQVSLSDIQKDRSYMQHVNQRANEASGYAAWDKEVTQKEG